MKNDFLRDRPKLRRMIRYAEIIVIAILAVNAALTWRELKILRAAPVILPASWFIVTAGVEKVNRVEAGGSWVSADGTSGNLQTTTIDCLKTRMQCMESSAQVAVNDGGFLENTQTLFDIESWTDTEIITKTIVQSCGSRTLILDIANKLASSVMKASSSPSTTCKQPFVGERTSKLVAGQKAHAAAVNKAKPF
ncbi:MAG: hypothetical protein ABI790_04655 [Betaproteobacteria bacterium]